jgi:hypothetical protein
VEEIARLLVVHKNTVRNWLKQGLTAIDRHKPTVVLGSTLSHFLQDRRQRAGSGACPVRSTTSSVGRQ